CGFARFLNPKRVIVGYDIRLSSPSLTRSLIRGLLESGVDVHDIGMCGTEEVYYAVASLEMDGGIMVTASHNPKNYNGMKLVREDARPISGDTGLHEIESLVDQGRFEKAAVPGKLYRVDNTKSYVDHLLGYVDVEKLKPLKIVTHAGNGGAGKIIDRLEAALPFTFFKMQHEPDGHFPNGVPNPLLEENRAAWIDRVKREGADLGVAWDGDFDRCFFVDETGRFIEGYYVVGLLAKSFLEKTPGAKVIHDPRLTWNTIDIVKKFGGEAIQSKTGHAFIKERMREEDAIYGGEMSAHHYFRDFSYCDSGMIPWLLVTELMIKKGKALSELVDESIERFPSSGEINNRITDPKKASEGVMMSFKPWAQKIDTTDGVSMSFNDWRFNLRLSNTEPVVRLNVESRGDAELMASKTEQILTMLVDM
ncbi:MAG: phosphomannomutase, partial [Desulfovibrionales bacterium]|nr:phosphomannomutase [Desulfovibrionales bacterium]